MKILGKFALWLASAAFLTGVSLFVIGSLILTWPILRLSPRHQKIQAASDLARAVMTTVQVFGQQKIDQLVIQAEGNAAEPGPQSEAK